MQLSLYTTLEYASAVLAFVAAAFWFAAFFIPLPKEIEHVDLGRIESNTPGAIDDFTRLTVGLWKQSRLNGVAAAMAGCAAVLQGLATFISGG